METKLLTFKWTVSRGRDTYGYDICSLYVDDKKVASCNGGGYDMQGTCLANWLQNNYQDRLLKRFADEINSIEDKDYKKNTSTGEKWFYKSLSFYGGHIIENKGGFKISLDGAYGFSSIEKIANEIGIFLQWNTASNKDKNKTYYLAKIED